MARRLGRRKYAQTLVLALLAWGEGKVDRREAMRVLGKPTDQALKNALNRASKHFNAVGMRGYRFTAKKGVIYLEPRYSEICKQVSGVKPIP